MSDTPTLREELRDYYRANMLDGEEAGLVTFNPRLLLDDIVELTTDWLGVDPDTPADQWRAEQAAERGRKLVGTIDAQAERVRCLHIVDGLMEDAADSTWRWFPDDFRKELHRRIESGGSS